MEANPQIIERTVPARLGGDGEPLPAHTYGDRTGMWIAREDGVTALSPTREKAEAFCREILACRKRQSVDEGMKPSSHPHGTGAKDTTATT
jgi:hypothetical protein